MPVDHQDQLCLLALCGLDDVGPVGVVRLVRLAAQRGMALAEALRLPRAELAAEAGLSRPAAGAVAALRDAPACGRRVLRQAAALGLCVLVRGGPGYPSRLARLLGGQAPPVLFVGGDAALLSWPRVAIVGSRTPSRRAAVAAAELAEHLAVAGTAVVSGGARGIDTLAHRGALRGAGGGGGTVAVPVKGLARFRWRPGGAGGWCLLGQFGLRAGWRSAHALMRNRTIVALSDAVVAFEPRDTGGTWHSSMTALRMRVPLFVASAGAAGAHERGLRRLVRLGAVALDPGAMPTRAELSRLIADYRPPPVADQAALFT